MIIHKITIISLVRVCFLYLLFLLRYWKYAKNNNALYIVEKTLESMYKGGIFDYIGFGFARYSVDEKWLVAHFEEIFIYIKEFIDLLE